MLSLSAPSFLSILTIQKGSYNMLHTVGCLLQDEVAHCPSHLTPQKSGKLKSVWLEKKKKTLQIESHTWFQVPNIEATQNLPNASSKMWIYLHNLRSLNVPESPSSHSYFTEHSQLRIRYSQFYYIPNATPLRDNGSCFKRLLKRQITAD